MSALSEEFNKKFKASLGPDSFQDNMSGRIETLEQEMNDPANAADLPWLTRERARLGPMGSNQQPSAGIPIDSPEAKALLAEVAGQGALSKVSALPKQEAQGVQSQGPLSSLTGPRSPGFQEADLPAMLAKFVPEDDSSSKYLAMAAALGRPTGFGSFGESMANVADALLEQKNNQQKLRAQYTPLIMQHVAAQQAREEQAAYRMEAAREARAAQMQAAQMAQQGRVELATQAQQAAKERAEADRLSREAIAADKRLAATSAEKLAGKPPSGYAWGPVGADGQPTLIAVKGGPADLKIAGQLNADTQALTGATAGFDRLAQAANEVLQHPGLPGITGLRGKLPNVPGTDAANAQALLGTLKSQVGFGVLQDMRNNSKTGGALGSVSDAEGKRLEANLASLENSQSVEQFRSNLKKIVEYAEQAKDRMRDAYNLKHADKPKPDTTPTSAEKKTAPKTVSWGDMK